jgi:hypothetical protein
MDDLAHRTDGASPAFIKEFLRRIAQHHLDSEARGNVTKGTAEAALHEMLFSGGTLKDMRDVALVPMLRSFERGLSRLSFRPVMPSPGRGPNCRDSFSCFVRCSLRQLHGRRNRRAS